MNTSEKDTKVSTCRVKARKIITHLWSNKEMRVGGFRITMSRSWGLQTIEMIIDLYQILSIESMILRIYNTILFHCS